MALAAVSPSLIPKCQSQSLPNPTLVHRRSRVEVCLLSISHSESADDTSSKFSSRSFSSFSSYFSGVKASLTHEEHHQEITKSLPFRQPLSFSARKTNPKTDFLEMIGKNLPKFGRRSIPFITDSSQDPSMSPLQQVYFSEHHRKSITANSSETSQVEETETDSTIQVVASGVAWASLGFLDEKAKKSPVSRIDVLSQLGQIGTRSFMLVPPKAYSVDRFFHPDITNVSENLKEEIKRARDEFKMHETDCGSSQVQIAVLSLKIRYLSAVTPKKNKQSLRGLNEMVVLRKSLLRYLRRTNWDTYCDVISRLGLGDNVATHKRMKS